MRDEVEKQQKTPAERKHESKAFQAGIGGNSMHTCRQVEAFGMGAIAKWVSVWRNK